ncbi:MAG TPA: hypothetical protein VII38_06885, partial [Polyangia bacterium]
MRRILLRAGRICAWVILWTLTIAAAVAIALVLVARSGPGRRLATRAIVPALEKRINGKVTVGKLEGDLTRRVILNDVVVRDATGQVALRIHRLVLDYDLLSLTRGRVELQSLTADGAELHLRELPDGRLNLASLLKQSESKGKPLELEARHVDLEGQVTWARARWPIEARFHASGSARRQSGHTDVTLTALTVHARRPLTARLSAAGALHLEDGAAPRLDGVRVTARAQGSELARLAPRLPPLKGLYRAQLSLGGTLDELVLHATVAPPRGSLALDGVAGIAAGNGLAWRGTLSARGLDPAALIAGAPPGVIELDAAGHGRGHQASVTLSRLHADAAGAHLDARGEASFARSLTARGTVDFDSRDLSRLATLGVPALAGALSVHARLSRAAGHNRVDANVHGRELEAATASLGTLDARIHARDLRGRAILHARDLILPVPSQHAPLRLDAVELAMSGDRRALALTLDARGPHGTSFALAAHGVPLDSGRGADVTIDRLLAALRGQRWESVRPGRLKVDAGVISGALALGSRHQRLIVSGSYRPRDRTLAVALDGQALDARRLAALVKPSLTLPRTELALHLSARGRLPRPSVEVNVHGTTAKAPHLGLGAAYVSVEARYQAR